ncbi:unnamed protein product [Protopolystoma xenopodis]|uniref:Uncharacterized protein n=1 Tax=Protopolystoma xenopodis TaxID=117903 RepID=A0A3S5A070_9PLAT|nr:unnamed protein product [Protopolystoma xenopodis]
MFQVHAPTLGNMITTVAGDARQGTSFSMLNDNALSIMDQSSHPSSDTSDDEQMSPIPKAVDDKPDLIPQRRSSDSKNDSIIHNLLVRQQFTRSMPLEAIDIRLVVAKSADSLSAEPPTVYVLRPLQVNSPMLLTGHQAKRSLALAAGHVFSSDSRDDDRMVEAIEPIKKTRYHDSSAFQQLRAAERDSASFMLSIFHLARQVRVSSHDPKIQGDMRYNEDCSQKQFDQQTAPNSAYHVSGFLASVAGSDAAGSMRLWSIPASQSCSSRGFICC